MNVDLPAKGSALIIGLLFTFAPFSASADCVTYRPETFPLAEIQFASSLTSIVKPLTVNRSCPMENYRKLLPPVDAALFFDGKKFAKHVLETEPKLSSGKLISNTTLLGLQLSNGRTFIYKNYRKDMTSLDEWILSQPLFSVDPHQLFSKALDLSGGDIEKALMLSWNLLEEKNKSTILERNTRERNLRLRDITGERPIYDKKTKSTFLGLRTEYDMRGDNFSAWYHFFGTALHSFTYTREGSNALSTSTLTNIEYTWYTTDVLYMKKRRAIDMQGAEFGKELAENYKSRKSPTLSKDFSSSSYLYDDLKFYDGKYISRIEDHEKVPMTAMEKVLLAKVLTARENLFPEKTRKCLIDSLETDPDKEIADYMKYLMGDKSAHEKLMSEADTA